MGAYEQGYEHTCIWRVYMGMGIWVAWVYGVHMVYGVGLMQDMNP